MKDVREGKRLQDMRRRLYDRTSAEQAVEASGLTDQPVDVSRNWDIPKTMTPPAVPDDVPATTTAKTETGQTATVTQSYTPQATADTSKPRRRYRVFILVVSLLIFIIGVGVSSVYLYFGGNQISSEQIALSLNGPFSVGGGEVLDLQIGLKNENNVTIESATLILRYPEGTRSVGDSPRTLFEERLPIRDIEPGEVRQVPVQVAVFGEEQSEHTIQATLEYRIQGSNDTFYKEAEPLSYTISSSPLAIRVTHDEKVSAGQQVDVTLTVVSNASSPLDNLLVTADIPSGFTYQSADPAPVFSNNVWRITELLPEEEIDIVITGLIAGLTEESFRINVDAGPAQIDNPFLLASELTEASVDFVIERPFIDVTTVIDDVVNGEAVLDQGETARIEVNVTNTLPEEVYDMVVEVIPGGNILTETSIRANSGFYDSNTGTVRWEVANNPSFATVSPDDTRTLSFSVQPAQARTTASFDLVVNVYARRVAEASAAEQLIGTSRIEAKYNSELFTGAQAGHNTGILTDRGTLSPQVGQETTYTLTMVAEAGVNDLADTRMVTSLPVYVEWLNVTQGEGDITFNPISKQIEWLPGNIAANNRQEMTFQVGFTPSVSQVGSAPILLNRQTLTGVDRFTNTRLQAIGEPVYTELSTEAGYPEDNGIVTR